MWLHADTRKTRRDSFNAKPAPTSHCHKVLRCSRSRCRAILSRPQHGIHRCLNRRIHIPHTRNPLPFHLFAVPEKKDDKRFNGPTSNGHTGIPKVHPYIIRHISLRHRHTHILVRQLHIHTHRIPHAHITLPRSRTNTRTV